MTADRFDEMARELISPLTEMAAMPIDETPYVSAVATALRAQYKAGQEAMRAEIAQLRELYRNHGARIDRVRALSGKEPPR